MAASFTSAHRITPVSPSPPMVAANRSAFSVGDSSRVSPDERASARRVTWQPKVPALSWFLPCTSLAIAPPRVTNLVPGVTGRNQPRGTVTRRRSPSIAPASARITPRSQSAAIRRSHRCMRSTRPPSFNGTSPYDRPSPYGMSKPEPSRSAAITSSRNAHGGQSDCERIVRPHVSTGSRGIAAHAERLRCQNTKPLFCRAFSGSFCQNDRRNNGNMVGQRYYDTATPVTPPSRHRRW